MTWDEKVIMVRLLNDDDYKAAVDYLSTKDVDNQAMDMFVTGFSLTEMELLNPVKDLIMNFDSNNLGLRSGIRLETMKEYFKDKEK